MNRFRLSAAFLAFAATSSLASADEPRFRLVDFSVGDWRLNHQARRVLADSEDMAKLNLGTSVKDRVLTVWGVVPSPAMSRQVEEALKSVPGVASVINECTVQVPEDRTPKDVASEVRRRLNGEDYGQSARPVTPAATTGEHRESLKPSARLGEPELDESEAPRAVVSSWDRLRDEAKALGLTVVMRSGDAVISGRPAKLSDAWNLAEKLAELPDVERVVFGPITKR